jgi:redox-sensitive bicupin YhaK (pirin superfamily)
MLTIRKADERGHANHGWLDTHHTFSFADYHDPMHMGFGPLRVINDDTIAAGTGFPPHGHRDMEIITYVVSGALQHRDNMGNGSVIRPGEVQRMSAGPGVVHAEYNASQSEPLRLLQIWILPARAGLPSGYEQKFFGDEQRRGRLLLVASPDGADGSVRIQQDARLYASLLDEGQSVAHTIARGRKGWLQVVNGRLEVNGKPLSAGDGLAVDASGGQEALDIAAKGKSELLLFDMIG